MSERLTDMQLKAWRTVMPGAAENPYDAIALVDELLALRAENGRLRKALQWFADDDNWREEMLSDGAYFSAEWRPGLDPREIAGRALKSCEIRAASSETL